MRRIEEPLSTSDPVSLGRLEDISRGPIFEELFRAIVTGSDEVLVSVPLGQPDVAEAPHPAKSRLGVVALVPLTAAAALIIALIAVPGVRGTQRSHGALGHGHQTNGVTAKAPAWRLVGDVSRAWQVRPTSGFEPDFFITCPTTTTCYVGNLGTTPGTADLEVTNDGGNTWQQIGLPVTLSMASRLACVGAATCALLGVDGSGNSYFLETTDGGQSWTTSPGPGQLTSAIGLVRMSCTSVSSCVAIASDPSGQTGTASAYVTDDGGNTWAETSLPQNYAPEGLQCAGASMCATIGIVQPAGSATAPPLMALYSTDGGSTWATASLPSTRGGIIRLSCADASDCIASLFGRAGTTDTELLSSDGGQTWADSGSSLPQATLALTCPSAADCWASGLVVPHQSGQPSQATSASGAISFTTDEGQTWQAAALPNGLGPVVDVSCPSDTNCFAIALQAVSGQPDVFYDPVLLTYGN